MLALIEYFFFGIKVGQARGKYGVKAPATTGNEHFERYHRVHQNTLEQLVISCRACTLRHLRFPMWAAIFGVVFMRPCVLLQPLHRQSDKRGPGVIVSVLASAVLVVGLDRRCVDDARLITLNAGNCREPTRIAASFRPAFPVGSNGRIEHVHFDVCTCSLIRSDAGTAS